MTTLIIGGDRIDSIKHELQARGVTNIAHWDGRKHGDKKNIIPKQTHHIVVITNFINHALTGKIKKEAKRLNIPIEYTKNSRRFMAHAA